MINTESPLNSNSTENIPAGGSEPEFFQCQEAWYPVHYLKDLDKSVPTPFTLLGKDIVIWWDENTDSWKAFVDQCPHRLARFSEGRVNEDGLLECPYHGWSFSGSGECVDIPQQVKGGNAQNSQRACAESLPTIEKQGLLFVFPGKVENAAKTKVPVLDALDEEPEGWLLMDMFRDIPYDALTLLENLLDPSHVNFTHHQTVGNRANAAPLELEVVESGKHGFKGLWKQGLNSQQNGERSTTFIAPSLMWHDINSEKARVITLVYATPIGKGECRMFARFPFKFASKIPSLLIKLRPIWYQHIGQNGVLEDDQIFLYHQERYLQEKGGSSNFTKAFYLPTKADAFVFEYRQWIHQYNAEPFPGEAYPPLLSREQLLERYHSHTKNCNSCKNTLKRVKQLKFLSGAIALLSLASVPLHSYFLNSNSVWIALLETAIPLVFVYVYFRLHKLEKQFFEGRIVPPRNYLS
ncbi:MAG: Rieske 2Fe-2S domain-containing protein [Cyanobacteria bacterium P01_A01_bin.45]